MNKLILTWEDVECQTQEILRQLQRDAWMPDYVVGLTRGGLIPANLISQYLEVPMECLKVSLRDDTSQPESNLWMAEDAYDGKKILIVDDINDTGSTLNWIRQDWQNNCLPNHPNWANVWGNNVKIAVLYDNEASDCELLINYCAETVNKASDPCWIVFPWEDWWK